MTSRQVRMMIKEQVQREYERMLDIFLCVERLYEMQLDRSIRAEKGLYHLPITSTDGFYCHKVDVEQLLMKLPLHLLACRLGLEPEPMDIAAEEPAAAAAAGADAVARGGRGGRGGGKKEHPYTHLTEHRLSVGGCHPHLHRGMAVLFNLCDFASHKTELRKGVLSSTHFLHRCYDLVLMVLLAAAGPERIDCHRVAKQASTLPAAEARAALVSVAMHQLLALGDRGRGGGMRACINRALQVVLAFPRCETLLSVMFDSVVTLLDMVRIALQANLPDITELCYQAGSAMEILTKFCDDPLMFAAIMHDDPSGSAPLRVVWAGLSVLQAPVYIATFEPHKAYTNEQLPARQGMELLAARALLLLFKVLNDHPPVPGVMQNSFLVHVSMKPASADMLQHIYSLVTRLTALTLTRAPVASIPVGGEEGQLSLNLLRAMAVSGKMLTAAQLQPMLRFLARVLMGDPGQDTYEISQSSETSSDLRESGVMAKLELMVEKPSDLEQRLQELYSGNAETAEHVTEVAMKSAFEETALFFMILTCAWHLSNRMKADGELRDSLVDVLQQEIAHMQQPQPDADQASGAPEAPAGCKASMQGVRIVLEALANKASQVGPLMNWDAAVVRNIGNNLLSQLP